MLAITNPSTTPRRITPNILPCSINHDGPVDAEQRHWCPAKDDDTSDTSTAYFRGRKLRGNTVKIPQGYQGVVLQKTDRLLPQKAPTAEQLRRMEEEDEEQEAMEQPVEVKLMQPLAAFDHVTVWDHEAVPDAENEYVKGIREWMAFAEVVHSHDTPTPREG